MKQILIVFAFALTANVRALSQNETPKIAPTETATAAQLMDGCVSGCTKRIAPRGSILEQSKTPVAELARRYLGESSKADLCSTTVKSLTKDRSGSCR